MLFRIPQHSKGKGSKPSDLMAEQTITIGELAKRGNVATSLLRYYEKEGLLEPVGRTQSGYRLYSPDSVRHLRFIRRAQRYGFSLSDIYLVLLLLSLLVSCKWKLGGYDGCLETGPLFLFG